MGPFLYDSTELTTDPTIKDFFESIHDSRFPSRIERLVNRINIGSDCSGCEFPENIDDFEEPFVGVRVWYLDDEETYSDNIFHKHLVTACEKYMHLYPESRSEILQYLAKIK